MSTSVERVYILTELGKRTGQNISPRGRDEIVDFIYSNKTVRLSELAGIMGISNNQARGRMRQYISRGLVQELTH